MNVHPASSPKPHALPVLTLLAHVDATPHDLEPFEVAEIDSFEQAHRSDARVRVQLSRQSRCAPVQIGLGLLEMATMPIAYAASVTLGPLGLAAAAGATLLGFDGAQRLIDGIRSLTKHREPSWNGTRVYDIGSDRTKALDSPRVLESDQRRPTVRQLGQFIADGMKQYPAQVTAFMASGHGLAYESCSGYSLSSLKKALDDAAAQSGRKVDVVILEACLMGNLESLDMLKDSARYAVVSEETMGAAGLPWKHIVGTLPQGSMTPAQFGQKIVDGCVGADGIDTVAVIDLQKVAPLTQSVNHLARELRRVVAGGGKSEVRSALRHASAYPQGFFDPLTRFSFDVRDLGDLCDSVYGRIADARVRDAADKVRTALEKAVVSSTTSKKYAGASHVTIQGPKPFFKADAYAQKTGFGEWGLLLRDLRRVG